MKIPLENHSTSEVQYTRLKKQKNNAKTKMVASVPFVGIAEGHGWHLCILAGDSWRVRHRCVEKVDSSCRDPLLIPGQTSFRRAQNLSSAGASQGEGHSEKSLRDGPRGITFERTPASWPCCWVSTTFCWFLASWIVQAVIWTMRLP